MKKKVIISKTKISKSKSVKTKKKTVSKKDLSVLEDISSKLFDLMGITSKVQYREDKANDALYVDIKGENETGLLIGARGRTLASLQTLLGLMFWQRVGIWRRIIVNVSDYREKEEERLRDLASQSAERAKTTGEPQYLYNLTPSQRRIVHMALSEESGVVTESQGEGSGRYLIITPKK